MTIRRHHRIIAAITACAVALPTGSALAALHPGSLGHYPKEAKFWISIKAHQHLEWKISPPPLDCAHASSNYRQGAGSEDIAFTVRRAKAAVIQYARGNPVVVYWNTWDPLLFSPAVTRGLIAKVDLNRMGYLKEGCQPVGKPDCGVRHANWGITLTDRLDRLGLAAAPSGAQPRDSARWVTCKASASPDLTPGEWTSLTSRLPAREIFDPAFGKQIVIAKRDYPLVRTDPFSPSGTATVRWEVTFTRVR
jgi:hypothetical protein